MSQWYISPIMVGPQQSTTRQMAPLRPPPLFNRYQGISGRIEIAPTLASPALLESTNGDKLVLRHQFIWGISSRRQLFLSRVGRLFHASENRIRLFLDRRHIGLHQLRIGR